MSELRTALEHEAPVQSSGRTDPKCARIQEHFDHFQSLVTEAIRLVEAGKYDAAAAYAQMTAHFASGRHPGVFFSPQLEHVLLTIGQTLAPPTPRGQHKPASRPHVLHVLTHAARIGGHTRMVWRWIQHDPDRIHSVVLTRQAAVKVPDALKEAVAEAGGTITVLDHQRGALRAWAQTLRNRAADVDVVILHVNPDDAIPVIAFADPAHRPPVVFLDHADQVYWLGVSVTDVLASLRVSGMELAQTRRSIPPERCVLLPIGLSPTVRTIERDEAKARLDLAPDSVVLLTVARPHKYAPFDGTSYPEVLLPVVEQHPEAIVLAIGAEASPAWVRAHQRTEGRIRALGIREDTALYYQAADIYLDTFPVSSITSLLEAGSYGIPLVGRRLHAAEWSVLGADTPALMKQLIRPASLEAYRETLADLITDAALRERLGDATRREIKAVHTGAGWHAALDALYERVNVLPPFTPPPVTEDVIQFDEVDLGLPGLFPHGPDVEEIMTYHARLLPLSHRVRLGIELTRRERPFPLGRLLPEWLGVRLERWHYPDGWDVYPSS